MSNQPASLPAQDKPDPKYISGQIALTNDALRSLESLLHGSEGMPPVAHSRLFKAKIELTRALASLTMAHAQHLAKCNQAARAAAKLPNPAAEKVAS